MENNMKQNTFGIEIETTGTGRGVTSNAIAAYFGTTAKYIGRHLDNWVIPMPDGRKWTVERDGSVTDPSAEIVSPVCRWEDIEMVQEVVRAVRAAGAKADTTCGIHVHVGSGGHTPTTLRNLVNMVSAKEEYLTTALGITADRRARWCKPVEPDFLQILNQAKPKDMEAFADMWYEHNSRHYRGDWRRLAAEHYEISRYHLLNLHAYFSTERPAHTIEFRAFNGTLHAGKVKAYIQLCLAINGKALAAKSASAVRYVTDNPAYYWRCWLLQLGLIGSEFATARKHLMANMPGNAAWRHGDNTMRREHDNHDDSDDRGE